MALISLSSPFIVIPEGTYIFEITKVEYKEKYGKLEITAETEDGLKHTERYNLLKANGEPNNGALAAFSFFVKAVFDDFELEEIDHEDLIGKFFKATIEHTVLESTKKEGETVTFARWVDIEAVDGYEEKAEVKKPSKNTTTKKTKSKQLETESIDLDDLLG